MQLYWALHGTEGANPECKYSAGARLFRTQRGTKGYCLGALPKCKYSVVRSSRTQPRTVGYHLGTLKYSKCMCSADSKKVTTIPWLQHIAEGKKVPTFETLFCVMLMCLWVLFWSTDLLVASSWLLAQCVALLSTELSVASSWLLAHCPAHFKNQGNLTSFRNGFERIALRSTNQGNWNSVRNGLWRIIPCASRSTLADILTRNIGGAVCILRHRTIHLQSVVNW